MGTVFCCISVCLRASFHLYLDVRPDLQILVRRQMHKCYAPPPNKQLSMCRFAAGYSVEGAAEGGNKQEDRTCKTESQRDCCPVEFFRHSDIVRCKGCFCELRRASKKEK